MTTAVLATPIPRPAAPALDPLGHNVARRLSEGLDDLPHDITERLRAARVRAVARRQVVPVRATRMAGSLVHSGGAAALQSGDGDDHLNWAQRLASLFPLLALVIGLVTIAVVQEDARVRELAEVDTELLTDVLPPSAYADPGFEQFIQKRSPN